MGKLARLIFTVGGTAFLTLAAMPWGARADEAQDACREGNKACASGDFDLAIRRYAEAIRLNPKDAVSFNNRGYAWLQKGDLKQSIADYDVALRLDPEYAKAHFFRGSAYEAKGDQDKAVADYTAAIRLDPQYARAYCDRGLAAQVRAVSRQSPGKPAEVAGPAAKGAALFVAPGGDDHNPGTIELPFATLYMAHQWARPGDTINLRAGTYPALIGWNKSGTPNGPITIQAYRGEDVRLQSSEQYTWTHVVDRNLGDCWKAEIPYLPIRYPGVQHTVWEDAVNAETNPGVQIYAIIKGGYACAAMNASADFAHPQAVAGLPLTDKSGKLLYDITWYDRNTKTLWFKSGPSGVTDPNRQLYVTSPRSGQFSIAGSYLKLNGLKFEYLFYFHQQDSPTGCDIHDCEIRHAVGGLCGGGARCTYTSLLIDKVGDWLTWRNGGYERGYLAHCFYFDGMRCVIANCFFGRSNKGGPIHNYPDGVAENVFDSNVLYHSDGGSIFTGTGKNYITNNVSLQKSYGLRPYINAQGFTFANNYSEAAHPLDFAFLEHDGLLEGKFERFAITGNVFNNTGGGISYIGNIVDSRSSLVDGNVYLGDQYWGLGLTQETPPRLSHADYASFASYRTAVQALPHCAAWEKHSRASPAAPRFDFTSFDAFLDSDPPLGAVLARVRRYVRGVIEPFPGAGPAISAPAAGDRG